MPSFYRDGARYAVDPTRSEARFCLNGIGLPVIRGTVPVRAGELIIDADEGIRTANFQLDAARVTFETALPLGEPDPRDIFGNAAHPVVEFETQWARERAPAHHELDGLLRLLGQEHVFSLRADRGAWEQIPDELQANQPDWYRGIVRGGLDRKAWELRSHSIADDLLLILGREVEFEVILIAGPRRLSAARRQRAAQRAS
jgi:YceI-like domain